MDTKKSPPPPPFGSQSPFDPFEPSPRSIEFKSRMQQEQEDHPDEFFFEAHMTLAPMPDMPPPSPPVTPLDARLKKLPSSSVVSSYSDHPDDMPMFDSFAEHDQEQGIRHYEPQDNVDDDDDGEEERLKSTSMMPAGQVASEQENEMPTMPTMAVLETRDTKSKKLRKKKSKKKSSSKKGGGGGKGTSSKEKKRNDKDSSSRKNNSKKTETGSGRGKGKYYSQYSNDVYLQQQDQGDDHSEEENQGSLLSFCRPKKSTVSKSSLPVWGLDKMEQERPNGNSQYDQNRYDHSMPTPKIGKHILSSSSSKNNKPRPSSSGGMFRAVRGGGGVGGRINTGELNSAAGEGTTVPQILSRIRFLTFALSGLTIVLESYAIFFNVLFLQAPMVILGVYLLFFIALLLLFEVVRGDPVPTSSVTKAGAGFAFVQVGGINATQVAELAWTMVLERKWARRTRYFLQNNFGMLYSCTGRGIYLCFVGSVAVGQNFILIELLGLGFMLMGLWTISLTYRFPSLEKAMIMNLQDEFGNDKTDDVSLAGGGSSVVTWSSIPSSIRSDETRSLLNKSVR